MGSRETVWVGRRAPSYSGERISAPLERAISVGFPRGLDGNFELHMQTIELSLQVLDDGPMCRLLVDVPQLARILLAGRRAPTRRRRACRTGRVCTGRSRRRSGAGRGAARDTRNTGNRSSFASRAASRPSGAERGFALACRRGSASRPLRETSRRNRCWRRGSLLGASGLDHAGPAHEKGRPQ